MSDNNVKSIDRRNEVKEKDPLGSTDQLASQKIPDGVDRRAFLMRSTLIGATAVMTGCGVSPEERAAKSSSATPAKSSGTPPVPQLSADLNVVKEQKGPVMTLLDEFYKVGPGPSSSHTIGPMRITYDFYQR